MANHNDDCWMDPDHHLCAVKKVLKLMKELDAVGKVRDQNYASACELSRELSAARKRIAELEAARG